MGMEFCVAYGADVNAQDGTGQTPLHYACFHAQFNYTTRMIRLLLQKGADPNIYDNREQQPTHVMENYARLDLRVMNELKDDINELLREGVESTSCFTKLFRCFQSLSVKKKFQKAKPAKFEPLYIGFFLIQVVIFAIFMSLIKPEFEVAGQYTDQKQKLVEACVVLFGATLLVNLVVSTQAAGTIHQPKLKSELRAASGEAPPEDAFMIEELMESVSDESNQYFERADVRKIMSSTANNKILDTIQQDKFIQLMKEMGEERHIDICFECKVIQTGRSRHCY